MPKSLQDKNTPLFTFTATTPRFSHSIYLPVGLPEEEELLEDDELLEEDELLEDELLEELLDDELLDEDELLEFEDELELLEEEELEPTAPLELDEGLPPQAASISSAAPKGKKVFFIIFTKDCEQYLYYLFCFTLPANHS